MTSRHISCWRHTGQHNLARFCGSKLVILGVYEITYAELSPRFMLLKRQSRPTQGHDLSDGGGCLATSELISSLSSGTSKEWPTSLDKMNI